MQADNVTTITVESRKAVFFMSYRLQSGIVNLPVIIS